jgi:hypothetical protein
MKCPICYQSISEYDAAIITRNRKEDEELEKHHNRRKANTLAWKSGWLCVGNLLLGIAIGTKYPGPSYLIYIAMFIIFIVASINPNWLYYKLKGIYYVGD